MPRFAHCVTPLDPGGISDRRVTLRVFSRLILRGYSRIRVMTDVDCGGTEEASIRY